MDDVTSLILKSIKVAASTIKNSSNRAKQGIFAVVAVIAIIASLSFTDTRIAYKVNYSGRTIATVSSKNHFNEALALVAKMVDAKDVESVVKTPEFNATVTLSENIDDTSKVADAIISNTDEIVEATVILVDGNVVARAEKGVVDTIINERLNSFDVDGAECTSYFAENVEYKSELLMLNDIDDKDTVKDIADSLTVITEVSHSTDVMVPYATTVEKTNEQVIGYNEVAVSGVSGVNRVTQDITMQNGEIVSCIEVENEVIVAPVNEVIVEGTAKTLASAKQKQEAHNAGFVFPLPDGTWKASSFYGDGRNHKGIDICAPSGTDIYAVADGTVIQAGWDGNYGYCVIIEHSNGMRTLYAHSKQLLCKAGDKVSQGEVIALVGTTGQSTGNHLHFEVIVGGKYVDPAPYINLD